MRALPAPLALGALIVIAHAGLAGGGVETWAAPLTIDGGDGETPPALVIDRTLPEAADDSAELDNAVAAPHAGGESGNDSAQSPARVPRQPQREAAPAAARDETTVLLPLALTENDEADWEREVKEAIRPLYDELAAAGVVETLYGVRDTVERVSAGINAAIDGTADAELRSVPEAAAWQRTADALDPMLRARTQEQIDNERLLSALLVEQWVSEIKPWFFGLIAFYLLWQIIRLGYRISRARSARARKHRSPRTHSRHSAASRMPQRR